MGLIKAFTGAAISYMNDLWEDYIYCDALDENTLMKKGHARRNPGAGANANDNVITNGSRIAVNVGQMMLVVENGRIIDFTAEPGGYEYNSSTEPSCFCGEFEDVLKVSFENMKHRFAFGGIAGTDQRVYFINTKEIMNNRFGFGNVPYRDSEFDITIMLRGFGIYSYVIVDPILFYTNVCGNVKEQFVKISIEPQLKTEIQNAFLPVFGQLSKAGVRYDSLSLHTDSMIDLLQEELRDKWKEDRGIEIRTMAFSNVLPDEASVDKIRELQESRVYSGNKAMLGARVGAAQANAMESAAENPSGAVNGFMGMGMAQQAGAVNVVELMKEAPVQEPREEPKPVPQENSWTCSCGMVNTMNFCPNCGNAKPKEIACPHCGMVIPEQFAGMKFCPNCGKER